MTGHIYRFAPAVITINPLLIAEDYVSGASTRGLANAHATSDVAIPRKSIEKMRAEICV